MSINTSEGNNRYLQIIKPFAKEVAALGQDNKSEILKQEAAFMEEYLYKVAERYGAGSIFPMASEKIIQITNEAFGGNLKVESKASQDINDGTDVKTAFVQSYENSFYSSVSGLRGKVAGIRAIIIYDYNEEVKFKYLVIPTELIENADGTRKDSINITYDKDGEVSLNSNYWSTQCSFYEYCMLPEDAFIHNYYKNEAIRRSKLVSYREAIFKQAKDYIIESKCTITEMIEGTSVDGFSGFYNTFNCKNDMLNFTEGQKEELRSLSSEMQEEKKEELKTDIYNKLVDICDSKNPTSITDLLTNYLGSKQKAVNSSWFSKYDGYYFGYERTMEIKELLEKNKEQEKLNQFKNLRTLIRSKHIISIAQMEKDKLYPTSRLKKNYENNTFYFESVVPDWKEQIDSLMKGNKR